MKTKSATKVSLIIIYTVFVATMNVGEERKTRLCVHFNSNQCQTQTPSSGLRKPSKEEGRQKARPGVCVRRSSWFFWFFFFFGGGGGGVFFVCVLLSLSSQEDEWWVV